MIRENADIVIVGAGAAGLMAGVSAGRGARSHGRACRVVALDGAPKLGVKVLVAGGGRCNVTHHEVSEQDYAGGSKNAVRSVLKRFGVADTVAFFESRGVRFKREETGKLFPTTDRAQTVLDALLGAVEEAGTELRHPMRVTGVDRIETGFIVRGDWGEIAAPRVILATGGKALPRSGSDGAGYTFARGLGHTVTEPVWPSLVPLKLADGCVLRSLGGVSTRARLDLSSGTGKRLVAFTNDTLCTHFGLSGPGPMDISRHVTAAMRADAGAKLIVCWLPDETEESVDTALLGLGKRSVGRWLRERLPERLSVAICDIARVDPARAAASLRRDERRRLVSSIVKMDLPVVGDRGFTHAETTAGGVPLGEITVSSMASKVCPGLYLCGEICDVDGRIGGFNFQWAWASGHIAGKSAAAPLDLPR